MFVLYEGLTLTQGQTVPYAQSGEGRPRGWRDR